MGPGMAVNRDNHRSDCITSFIWSDLKMSEEADETQQRVTHGTKDRQNAWREKQRSTKDYALEPKEPKEPKEEEKSCR
jgi:hypothetical protein